MYSDNVLERLNKSSKTALNTDSGNGKRFVQSFAGDLLHCPKIGWLAWDGKRFKENEGVAIEYAKALAQDMFDCADTDANRQWALKSQSWDKITSMLNAARTDRHFAVSLDNLDRQVSRLTVRNGELDLEKMELHPHNRMSASTKLVDIDYDPAAACPFWDEFLLTVMDGDRDNVLLGIVSPVTSVSERCLSPSAKARMERPPS